MVRRPSLEEAGHTAVAACLSAVPDILAVAVRVLCADFCMTHASCHLTGADSDAGFTISTLSGGTMQPGGKQNIQKHVRTVEAQGS